MYEYTHQMGSDLWSHFKGHDMQDLAKEHDIKWGFYFPYNPQQKVDRNKKNILKQ